MKTQQCVRKKPVCTIYSFLLPVAGFVIVFALNEFGAFTESTHGLTGLFFPLELLLYFLLLGLVLAIAALVRKEKIPILGWIALVLNGGSSFFLMMA